MARKSPVFEYDTDDERAALSRVCGGQLQHSVGRSGGVLTGLSVKFREYEVLLTVRADLPAGGQVCFVSADRLGSALRKLDKMAREDALRWREDKWKNSQS